MKHALSLAASLCALLGATSAHAQSGPPAGSGAPIQGDTVTVGLGIGVTTSYDGARDYRIIPGGALLGTVGGHDFRLNGLQLFVDAIPNDPRRKIDVEFGPVAGVGFNRTGDVSDRRVEALGELDTAVELGARGSVGVRSLLDRTDKLAIAVTGVWDVAGAHRSHIISPSVEYSRLVGRRTFMRLALTGEFVGKGWASYNFGIDAAGSAASGLAMHDPDGGLASIGGSVLATHSLSGKRPAGPCSGLPATSVSRAILQPAPSCKTRVRQTSSSLQSESAIPFEAIPNVAVLLKHGAQSSD